ncbi:MAG TPA: DUF1361 domain-containing protein, partial [Chitinophagaceae bacterium]|nr:DUF1361 domain-containing protein [Chitinophagaceae bacterium]
LFPIMLLNAFGIYIGRYLRYNSWDAITNPLELSGDIALMFLHPFQNFYAWGMIGCFAAFLVILYLTMMELIPTGSPH